MAGPSLSTLNPAQTCSSRGRPGHLRGSGYYSYCAPSWMPRAVCLVKAGRMLLPQRSSPVRKHRHLPIYLRLSISGSCSGPTFASTPCLRLPDTAVRPLVRQALPAGPLSTFLRQQSHRKKPRAGPAAPCRSCLYHSDAEGHDRLQAVVRRSNIWADCRRNRSGSHCEPVHLAAYWPWPNVNIGVCLAQRGCSTTSCESRRYPGFSLVCVVALRADTEVLRSS
jgi:hypothetical protein